MTLRRIITKPATQYTGDKLPTPRTCALVDTSNVARLCVPIPKPVLLRSELYRRWVASLDCAHCGLAGFSNACHVDEGKGMGIKSCDSTVWPGCVTRPDHVGCHDLVGASGYFLKPHRRTLERGYGEDTREAARLAGKYPVGWP